VRSVVALANALQLEVIGEGIELRSQAQQLQALGCDRGQAYFFARRQPAAAITAPLGRKLDEHQRRAA
jgi:EAL domain-containing protein (putative c-di-GMP-specific phosphodiesterase class I)